MTRDCAKIGLAVVLIGACALPLRAQDSQDVRFRYAPNPYPLAPAGGEIVTPVYPGLQTRFQVQAASQRLTEPDAASQPLPPLPGQPTLPIEEQPQLLPPTEGGLRPTAWQVPAAAPQPAQGRAPQGQVPAPFQLEPSPARPQISQQPAPRFTPPTGPALSSPGRSPTPEVVPPGRVQANEPQAQQTWTLQQVTSLAERYNPVLRRAQARVESARGDALQAALYRNPEFDTNNPQVFNGTSSLFNVGFKQPIMVKGKFRMQKAAANQAVERAQYTLVSDRFDMLMAVRQQFYTVLAAERRVQVLTELNQIAASSLKAGEGRVKAGEGTLPEVLLLRTEAERAQINLINARTLLEGERKQLAAVIGLPELAIENVAADFEHGAPDFDEQGLRRFVVSENADVQVARRDLSRNQILYERSRADAYPDLNIGPAYQYSTFAPGNQQFWFNITFNIPVWDRNQGNIRSAQADVIDALATLGTVQNDLLRQAADAISRYRAARERADRIATVILPNARRAQELVKDGFVKGLLDISTFLQAQRTLTETTQDYIDALETVWTTAAEISSLLQLERFP